MKESLIGECLRQLEESNVHLSRVLVAYTTALASFHCPKSRTDDRGHDVLMLHYKVLTWRKPSCLAEEMILYKPKTI